MKLIILLLSKRKKKVKKNKLPLEKQEEIESEILKKRKEINPQIKKISTLIFYKMIASDVREFLIRENLL